MVRAVCVFNGATFSSEETLQLKDFRKYGCQFPGKALFSLVSYLFYTKNSKPFSQFFRLHRLFSDDSDFSEKSEAMCQFFDKRGCPASVVQAGHHHA